MQINKWLRGAKYRIIINKFSEKYESIINQKNKNLTKFTNCSNYLFNIYISFIFNFPFMNFIDLAQRSQLLICIYNF